MMTEKGVYPYDYITSYDVLKEKEKEFYSKLYNEACSDKAYDKAEKVYETFKCK